MALLVYNVSSSQTLNESSNSSPWGGVHTGHVVCCAPSQSPPGSHWARRALHSCRGPAVLTLGMSCAAFLPRSAGLALGVSSTIKHPETQLCPFVLQWKLLNLLQRSSEVQTCVQIRTPSNFLCLPRTSFTCACFNGQVSPAEPGPAEAQAPWQGCDSPGHVRTADVSGGAARTRTRQTANN